MKKTLIALIILTLSFGVVGCDSDKEETTSNSNEVVTQEESKENDKRSSDEYDEGGRTYFKRSSAGYGAQLLFFRNKPGERNAFSHFTFDTSGCSAVEFCRCI